MFDPSPSRAAAADTLMILVQDADKTTKRSGIAPVGGTALPSRSAPRRLAAPLRRLDDDDDQNDDGDDDDDDDDDAAGVVAHRKSLGRFPSSGAVGRVRTGPRQDVWLPCARF
jgi:hypothetical protein